jgi:hypothetical protein
MKICTLKKPASVYTTKEDKSSLIADAGFVVFDSAETVLAISV